MTTEAQRRLNRMNGAMVAPQRHRLSEGQARDQCLAEAAADAEHLYVTPRDRDGVQVTLAEFHDGSCLFWETRNGEERYSGPFRPSPGTIELIKSHAIGAETATRDPSQETTP